MLAAIGFKLMIVGDAGTPASGRDGISPSRKLSCQGSVGITPLLNLASRPQTFACLG